MSYNHKHWFDSMALHIPVLLDPWIASLDLVNDGVYVDGTLGLAGHAVALLEQADTEQIVVTFIGIDRDTEALEHAKKSLKPFMSRHTIHIVEGLFSEIDFHLQELNIKKIDGILLDVGVSSLQLDIPERGFSFRNDGPLDMRMSFANTTTAATIVNTWSEQKLAMLLKNYGEEHLAKKIARTIIERRRKKIFSTTADLAEHIRMQYPPALQHKAPHPATKTFQAIRIEVNQELNELYQALMVLPELINPYGQIAVMTFHSLEDRIVKQLFAQLESEKGWKKVTRKPVVASLDELQMNTRSRSAKLRIIQAPADR